jgi:signal transduction histidine kinase
MLTFGDLVRFLSRDGGVSAAMHAEAVGRLREAVQLTARLVGENVRLSARLDAEHEQLDRLADKLSGRLDRVRSAIEDRGIEFERNALTEAYRVVGYLRTIAVRPASETADMPERNEPEREL